MTLTFDLPKSLILMPVPVCREDGSRAFTIQGLPNGSIELFGEEGQQLGSITTRRWISLGPDLPIGQVACTKNFQVEWYQIHYFHFWTAEKLPRENSYRVSIRQGEPIGTIRRQRIRLCKFRYTLETQDPRYFLMMVMLSLAIAMRRRPRALD